MSNTGGIALKTDELREVQSQFLASLNHEIRTPLSGILGMTDLLLETPLTEDQLEYVGATRLCAENLLEILNVTLEYSALSADHVLLEETEFALGDTLQGVLGEFATKPKPRDCVWSACWTQPAGDGGGRPATPAANPLAFGS